MEIYLHTFYIDNEPEYIGYTNNTSGSVIVKCIEMTISPHLTAPYDEIGLLSPSSHTDAGHRLYSESDIIKLQQIISLKQLDFSLDEIKEMFDNSSYNPQEVITMQLERLDEEIRIKEALRNQLKELKEVFDKWGKPTSEQFIKSIQLITDQSRYFSNDQRIKLKMQYDKLDTAKMVDYTNRWNSLISALQAEMEKGTPSNAPIVMELAKKWQEGIDLFTGGDRGIIQAAERYYSDNPNVAMGTGMSGELYKYITKALSTL